MQITQNQYRTDITGLRHYNVDNFVFPSVTSLIKKAENREAFFSTWREKNPNDNSAARGTKFHKEVEDYFNKSIVPDSPLFQTAFPILQKLVPFYVEEKVYFRNDLQFGFAGTADFLGHLNLSCFQNKATGQRLPNMIEPVIVDFKTWSRPKYPKSMTANKEYYYPLVSYFLQLSAYRAAFAYSKGMMVDTAIILGVVEGSKTPYIYYLSAQELNYYWFYIEQMLDAFFKEELFKWDDMLKQLSQNKDFLGMRLELVS